MKLSRPVRTALAVSAATVLVGGAASTSVASTSLNAAARTATAKKPAPRGPFAGLTPAQIKARTAAAMKPAKTTHVTGTVVTKTQTFGIDLHVGAAANGTLTWKNGGTMTIRRVGATLFLRPDDAYYAAHKHPEVIPQRHGTWITVVAADPDYKDILPLTQLGTWTRLLGAVPATKRLPGARFGTVPTVALYGGRGPKATWLYVAATGPSVPRYIRSTDKLDHLAFQQWNAAVATTAPNPGNIQPELPDAVVDVPADPVASAAAFGAFWRP